MSLAKLYIVDVFAEEKYAGNQLAVVTGAAALSTEQMQRIAHEMHFSETTFVTADAPVNGGYDVRIFTPASEMPFAGHPTLGTASIIREYIAPQRPAGLSLNLQVGSIPVRFEAAKDGGELAWLEAKPAVFGAQYTPGTIAPLLGLSPDDVDTRFPIQDVSTGLPFVLVPLKSLAAVKRARFNEVESERRGAPAVAFFMFAPETYHSDNDLNARMFAHDFGVPEDPATGSAATCLGAYLVHYRYFGSPSVDIRIEQGYEVQRPSLLFVQAREVAGRIRVQVGGQVILVARGELV